MKWAIWNLNTRSFMTFWSWYGSPSKLVMFDEVEAKEFADGYQCLRAVPWDEQAQRIHKGGA